jgi:uncharacterized protein (TIGR03067 family)
MKNGFLALSIFALLPMCAAHAQDDAVKKELAKMEGTWDIVSGVERGEPSSEHLLKNLKFVFKGNQLTFAGDDVMAKKVGKIAVKIDATTTPKCIDLKLKVDAGAVKDLLLEGIYEFKGDELKLCISEEAGNRPLEFESKEGSNRVLFVLKRQKP